MASTESPKAKEIPTAPTYDPARTMLPQPMKTRTNVPRNSAAYFFAGFSSVSVGGSDGFWLSVPFDSIFLAPVCSEVGFLVSSLEHITLSCDSSFIEGTELLCSEKS